MWGHASSFVLRSALALLAYTHTQTCVRGCVQEQAKIKDAETRSMNGHKLFIGLFERSSDSTQLPQVHKTVCTSNPENLV